MAIKIEILDETTVDTSVAFYYPIPPGKMLPGAVNPDKVAAGVALPPEELEELKLGAIYEVLVTYTTTGLDVAARQSKFVSEWAMLQGSVQGLYEDEFAGVGSYYDGQWSKV